MICGAFFLYKNEIVTVNSKWYGKTATVILYIAIVLSLLSIKFTILSKISLYLYYIALTMTIFAGIMYAKKFLIGNTKKVK